MPFDYGPILTYEGAGRYKTVHKCEYVGKDQVLHIPAEFVTDLATVPRLFWALLPPTGAYEKAAVLHDVLCTRLAVAYRYGQRATVSSRDTDGLFRRVMRECGVRFVTRWVMWAGVRYGALANPAPAFPVATRGSPTAGRSGHGGHRPVGCRPRGLRGEGLLGR